MKKGKLETIYDLAFWAIIVKEIRVSKKGKRSTRQTKQGVKENEK